MPTLSEMPTEILEILAKQPWGEAGSVEERVPKEKSRSVTFQLASQWQEKAPEQSVYSNLPRLFDSFLFEVASNYTEKTLQTADEFEKVLVQVIFSKLIIDLHMNGDAGWGSTFIQLGTADIAALIRHLSYVIIQHGWQESDRSEAYSCFNWMKDQATMMRASLLSAEQQLELLSLSNRLSDPSLFSIPVHPRFCMSSEGRWYIFDEDVLHSMQSANQDYRELINTIDNSGPSGVGYILTQIRDEEDEVIQARDKVLAAWYNHFPMVNYLSVDTDTKRQKILKDYERWLDKTDRVLDWGVWYSLPEQVRQIVELRNQVKTEEAHLLSLTTLMEQADTLRAQRDQLEEEFTDEDEDELSRIDDEITEIEAKINQYASIDDISAHLESLNHQFAGSPAIGDLIDLDRLRANSVDWVQTKLMINREDATPDSVLLNIDTNSVNSLTEEQLVLLVNQAVDALIARDYSYLNGDQSSQLRLHLDSRREKQLELRSNAEGSLRTCSNADGEITILSENQVRAPIDRSVYINVDDCRDGNDFRDIIIGGCLWAAKTDPSFELPDEITGFIPEQRLSEPLYKDRAILKFIEFRIGNLDLVLFPKQLEALARFRVTPIRVARYDLVAQQGLFAVNPDPDKGLHLAGVPTTSL